jgi:transcriptional regulator with XRE-family HTH domain
MAASDNGSSRGTLSLEELGKRVRAERLGRGLSLDELTGRSGVSRSMISAIERGAKAATVIVLDRLATGLGTSLARLLSTESRARVIPLPRGRQAVARDPAGWERRILSPVLPGVEFEFMRTTLGPGVDAGTFLPHAHGSREYVAVEAGTLLLGLDGERHTLAAGDSIYYDGDCLHSFANASASEVCVYYLAMDVSGDAAGTEHRLAPAADASSRSLAIAEPAEDFAPAPTGGPGRGRARGSPSRSRRGTSR